MPAVSEPMTVAVTPVAGAAATDGYPQLGYAWYVVGLLALASMVGYIDRMILNLVVEPIKADLGVTDVQVSLLQGFAFAMFFALAGLPIARMADYRNRCRIIGFGIATWSLMTIACGLARDYPTLFLARIGVGIGEAALLPATFSLLVDYFPRARLARANSIFIIGAAVGAGVALLFGAQLLSAFDHMELIVPGAGVVSGWKLAFIAAGMPGVMIAALVLITVQEPLRRQPRASARSARADLFRFARSHRWTLVCLFLAYPLAGAASQGWLAWFPSYLIRTFGVTGSEAAMLFGAVILSVGVGGTWLGGVLAGACLARRRPTRLIHLTLASMAAFTCAGVLAPASGQLAGAVLGIAAFIFFGSVLAVLPPLTFQLLAPPSLCAQIQAGYVLIATIIGAGCGPTVVAVLNERVFGGGAGVGSAMALAAAVLGGAATIVLASGRAAFRRSLEDATRLED